MNNIDWKNILKTVAPTIATALGGPLAGLAVNTLSSVLGKENTTEKEIASFIMSGNPDVFLKLKESEQNFKLRLEELGIDLERIHAEDRKSAREREIAVKDKMPALIALMLFLGFFGITGIIMFHVPPAETKDLMLILIGALTGGVVSIVQYYFGSSSGSAKKNEMLERVMKG